MHVPFLDPPIRSSDAARMLQSLFSGWLVPGDWTEQFERSLARYFDAQEAVMTSSGTAALHLSLALAGVGEGDEVITTPMSWVATSNAILHQRARPVFVDIKPDSGLIDVDRIEACITERTKAILPVHLYGQMVDMQRIADIAARYGLAVVEDAAHAIEARYGGHAPGHSSRSACLSFQAGKNITCGRGGAIVTNDSALAEQARALRRHGIVERGGRRQMTDLGYTYESTDFQAALLVGQLERIEELHDLRCRVFERYRDGFHDTTARVSETDDACRHACHLFTVRVNAARRTALRAGLAERGIQTSVHYEPIHLTPYYRETFGYKEGDFPVAEQFGRETISLPTYATLTEERQWHVIQALLEIVSGHTARALCRAAR